MVIVGVLFFLSTRFISQNINKVFSSEGTESVQVLNLERYQLIAKKLGITVSTVSENTSTSTAAIPTPEVPVVLATAGAPTATTLDKQALTITVLNSTAKKGVASTLAKSLESAGFATPTTGNEGTPYPTTTILIKESKYDYAPLILAEVTKTYPDATTATTSDGASFDAVIIIGGR